MGLVSRVPAAQEPAGETEGLVARQFAEGDQAAGGAPHARRNARPYRSPGNLHGGEAHQADRRPQVAPWAADQPEGVEVAEARMAGGEGAGHGNTRLQGSQGPADWTGRCRDLVSFDRRLEKFPRQLQQQPEGRQEAAALRPVAQPIPVDLSSLAAQKAIGIQKAPQVGEAITQALGRGVQQQIGGGTPSHLVKRRAAAGVGEKILGIQAEEIVGTGKSPVKLENMIPVIHQDIMHMEWAMVAPRQVRVPQVVPQVPQCGQGMRMVLRGNEEIQIGHVGAQGGVGKSLLRQGRPFEDQDDQTCVIQGREDPLGAEILFHGSDGPGAPQTDDSVGDCLRQDTGRKMVHLVQQVGLHAVDAPPVQQPVPDFRSEGGGRVGGFSTQQGQEKTVLGQKPGPGKKNHA